MIAVPTRPALDSATRAKKRQDSFRSSFSHVPRCRYLQLGRPGKSTDDFLEPIPLRCGPDLCLRMPEGSDQGRNLGRRFNVVGDKDIEVIARPEHGVAAEPLHGWALLPYALHDVAFELFKGARRTDGVGIQARQHDERCHGSTSHWDCHNDSDDTALGH